MVRLLLATALATFTPVMPNMSFTSDSVYKCDDILTADFEKCENFEETYLVDVYLKENKLLGYKIYNDPSTPYVDGIKWDGEWLADDWIIRNVDFSKEHTLQIKTVYTTDYAGMIMSAKDGDWSLMLQNPENVLKLVYYALATVSIVFGGFSLLRNRKFKLNIKDQIATALAEKSEEFKTNAEFKINSFVDGITPVIEAQEAKYNNIIKGLMLSQSKDAQDTLALIELLEKSNDKEEILKVAEQIKTKVTTKAEAKAAEIAEAKAAVQAIAKETVEAVKPYDGTQI